MNNVANTDNIMVKTWCCLVSDFRKAFGINYASVPRDILLGQGIKAFRDYKFPSRSRVSTKLFKAEYQLEAFFKRYRFEDDVYSDQELHNLSINKFIDTQKRLDQGFRETPLLNAVLREARNVASKILGPYSLSEHQELCRFGKRACVGTPRSKSYLDEKVSRPLTGSLQHIRWFKNYLKTDELLCQAIREASGKKRPQYKMCETLKVSHVPKSYKSLRAICPDTLLGSFYTAGLGRLMAAKLKEAGLNIRRLPSRHGRYAMDSSITRQLVTADLSAASDSLTSKLLMRVLPLPWYRAAMFGRIPFVEIGDQRIRMNTVLTMGLGHTFPLQTLVFYALLEGIRLLTAVKGKVSVYGDDLIYPRQMHRHVSLIFPQLLLILNEDKTYAQDNFRESCGHDYYRGCAVRPFSLEGGHHLLSGAELERFFFNLYNGLTNRWRSEEIQGTLEYIRSELILRFDRLLYVPTDFPETAGIKVDINEGSEYFAASIEPHPAYQSCSFGYLRDDLGKRKVKSQTIYYWDTLRRNDAQEEYDPYSSDFPTSLTYKKVGEKRVGKLVEAIYAPYSPDKEKRLTRLARGNSTQFGQLLQLTEFGELSGRSGRTPVVQARSRIAWLRYVRREWRSNRLKRGW